MHDYWKNLTGWTFVDKVMSLLLNMLSGLVITFLSRSKCLLISWLQSPSAVILEPPKIKSATIFTVFPSIYPEVMGPDAMILVFWMLSFKPTFSLSSFTFIKRLFGSSSLSANTNRKRNLKFLLTKQPKETSCNNQINPSNSKYRQKKKKCLIRWLERKWA